MSSRAASELARAPTVGRVLPRAIARLHGRDPGGARLDATLLLAHVLARDPAWLLAHDEAPLGAAEAADFAAAVARREGGEPIAYILGSAGFFGRTFAVGPAVLVPRPETELAVEAVLGRLSADARVCDVGTGSGAIAVTLACERPSARFTAIDISDDALAMARANANMHGVDRRIRFVRGNGLDALGDDAERFDCIVANLPYVKTRDLRPRPDPTSFEPRVALDGGDDGLALYRCLLRDAPARLAPGGFLVLEAGADTVGPLAELARSAFLGMTVQTTSDYGGLSRLVVIGGEEFYG